MVIPLRDSIVFRKVSFAGKRTRGCDCINDEMREVREKTRPATQWRRTVKEPVEAFVNVEATRLNASKPASIGSDGKLL